MGWERKRGKLDELNRLLPARADRRSRRWPGPAAAVPAGVRYVITLDADTRLPRGAVNRLVGTMAHPLNRPVFDAARGPRRRRLRDPAAAHHAHDAPGSRPLALPADLLRPGRDRSLRRRGLRRLPGPLRRGLVHRQGHLRRGRVRRGAGGPRPRERAPQPRSLRGDLRPRRTRHRHRALRGVPHRLRGRGRAPAPLGARRLAAAALDDPGRHPRGGAADLDPARRPVEDARQSPADAVGAGRRGSPWSPAGCSRTASRSCGPRSCSPPSRCPLCSPRSPSSSRSGGHLQAHPLRASARTFAIAVRPDRARASPSSPTRRG